MFVNFPAPPRVDKLERGITLKRTNIGFSWFYLGKGVPEAGD